MIEIRLGDRYAKSVLDLAIERNELEQVREDFILIESVCDNNPDFVNMLKSPLIKSYKKQNIIDAIFAGKLNKLTEKFIKIIVDKNREGFLRDIAIRFLALYDGKKNITRGVLTSAHPMSQPQKDAIRALVQKELQTTFEWEEKVDPELIGGFTLLIGDRMFDGSIAADLRRLRQSFENNSYVKEV